MNIVEQLRDQKKHEITKENYDYFLGVLGAVAGSFFTCQIPPLPFRPSPSECFIAGVRRQGVPARERVDERRSWHRDSTVHLSRRRIQSGGLRSSRSAAEQLIAR